MAASRSFRILGLVILATFLQVVAARAQESPPAEPEPDAVLKSHELKRRARTWVLPGETAVLKDLRDAKDLYRQVAEGMAQQQQLEYGSQNRKGMVLQLREQNDLLGQQIGQLDQQLESLNFPGGGNLVQLQRDQVNRQRQALVAENNRIVNQLNGLQEQGKDQDQEQKLQLNAEVGQTREKYMQSVLDLRTSVDKIKAKYDALGKDPEVTKALEALSASTKSKHKLGPSKALAEAIKLLERAEKHGPERLHPDPQGERGLPRLDHAHERHQEGPGEDGLRHRCRPHHDLLQARRQPGAESEAHR